MKLRSLLPIVLLTAGLAVPAAPATAPKALNPGLGPAPADVFRSTPRETVLGFLDACRDGNYRKAAHYLDLTALPQEDQPGRGAMLARRFKFVLDQKLWIDPDALSEAPEGATDDGLPPGQDRVGKIPLAGGEQGIRVVRVPGPAGGPVWVFGPNTVRAIDSLYEAYGIGWIGDHLPAWLFRHRVWEFELWQLLLLGLLLPVSFVLGHLGASLGSTLVVSAAGRTRATWDDELAGLLRRPLRLFVWASVFGLGASALHLSVPAGSAVFVVVRTTMLVALGLFGHGAVRVVAREMEARLVRGQTDERRRKGVATQVSVLQRIASGGIVLLVLALALAQFQVVRTVGLSLLASAGLAGIVVGFAAQRSVANLFAGIQIMLTQPIRIDDVVIVEGEWGTIEEINFTHVVVKIWDLRRLVVPISYFLERSFQNWTRAGTALLGTIYFYTDYTIDLEAMRRELDRILAKTELWDGQVKGIVVTDLKDHVVEVRALVSAVDSGKQWDLRCLVRERLLDWLKREARALPTFRIEPRGSLSRETPEATRV